MSIFAKLLKVQVNLKAPKGQFNNFGKYKYRSCEDIVEAVKPILSAQGLTMTMSDDLVLIGNRYYIKATVTVIDVQSGDKHEVTAFAREEENKKGMDGSQITGASSSYARKYALNGMFAIDDTKDSDATNSGDSYSQPPKVDKPREEDKPQERKKSKAEILTATYRAGAAKGLGREDTEIFLTKAYGVDKLSSMTIKQLEQAIEAFGRRTNEQIAKSLEKLKEEKRNEPA